MSIEESIKGYMAGIVDGEGCITIAYHPVGNGHYQLIFTISMLEKVALEPFVDSFGGKIKSRIRPQSLNDKIEYTYRATVAQADLALETLLPYLRSKRKQAEIALQFGALIRDYKYSQSVFVLGTKRALWEEMQEAVHLTGRGRPKNRPEDLITLRKP